LQYDRVESIIRAGKAIRKLVAGTAQGNIHVEQKELELLLNDSREGCLTAINLVVEDLTLRRSYDVCCFYERTNRETGLV
jgi:hypothetical protein